MNGRIVRTVRATTPVRVADVGGWTDTWFGSPGQVCSVAVGPGVEVRAELVRLDDTATDLVPPVHLIAPDLGESYRFGPSIADSAPHANLDAWAGHRALRQPLLEYAVAEALGRRQLPAHHELRLTISSGVPVGASLGTSAAVLVALLAAVDAAVAPAAATSASADPGTLARRAHAVETGRGGREAGVQDHWAAALGHAQHLVIDTYPNVRARRLDIEDRTMAEVAGRLVTVVFRSHDSSAVHGEVIHALLSCDGPAHHRVRQATRQLASLATDAAAALEDGDVDRWAGILTRSTEVQSEMHPGLVGPDHHRAIEVARNLRAAGWKVNGAGGTGGSLTIVAGSPDDPTSSPTAEISARLTAADPHWQVPDLAPSGGLTVVVDEPPA